jgi:hypothetical protein
MTWPLYPFPAQWLEYDWHSGLWEATPGATTHFGFGVFGAWLHVFLDPV